MSEKPSFLGLLNAVSLGESAAHCYLEEWIAVTEHEGVRQTLQTVSAREGEHGLAFAKRINELGYTLKRKDDPGQAKRIDIASSTTMTDLEKMEAFGLGRLDSGDKPDVFASFFNDNTIDPITGALLGRYIAEERDSGRRLRACYEQLCAEAGRPATKSGRADDDRLAALDAKVDAVCAAIEDLRDIVTASVEPSSNGTGKRRAGVK